MNRPVERERERGVEAPAIEGTAPAAAPRASALLALQRSAAGDQAVARALMQRAPKDPPEGVSLPADPLPAGANVADPDAARIVADPSLPGGWNDKSTRSESGHVGGVDRILLEGMPGNQEQQTGAEGRAGARQGRRGHGRARAGGSRGGRSRSCRTRSRAAPAGEVAVLVHFHGIGKALRGRGENPRDVDHYQVEQQMDAFTAAKPGARIIALLPIGIQTEGNERQGQDRLRRHLRQLQDGHVRSAAAFGAAGRGVAGGRDAGRRDHVRAQRRRSAARARC